MEMKDLLGKKLISWQTNWSAGVEHISFTFEDVWTGEQSAISIRAERAGDLQTTLKKK